MRRQHQEGVAGKTEAGDASLSENTTRFRKKVATLVKWRRCK